MCSEPFNLINWLPVDLACCIFNDWMELRELVRLDSCFCSHTLRTNFLAILRSEECVVKFNVDRRNMLRWLLQRKIKARCIKMDDSNCIKMNDSDLNKYIEFCGNYTRNLQILDKSSLSTVRMNCSMLQHFSYKDSLDSWKELGELLERNENLMSLDVERIKVPLKAWTPRGMAYTLSDLLSVMPLRLVQLNLRECRPHVNSQDLFTISQQCRQLRSMGLHLCTAKDNDLLIISKGCIQLINVDIEDANNITDTGVTYLAQHLPLRCLRLANCKLLTDNCLAAVMQFSAGTIEQLYVDSDRIIGACADALRSVCTKLHTFRCEYTFGISSRPSPMRKPFINFMTLQCITAYFYAASNFGGLKTLIIMNQLSENVLQLIINRCPNLHTIVLLRFNPADFINISDNYPHICIHGDHKSLKYDLMKLPIP